MFSIQDTNNDMFNIRINITHSANNATLNKPMYLHYTFLILPTCCLPHLVYPQLVSIKVTFCPKYPTGTFKVQQVNRQVPIVHVLCTYCIDALICKCVFFF
uniref:Uncharacterized protein n=1 Tax=Cacopsylla melanoneura TaxID=428564 RepID=A0A8D9BP78_9HEMI